MGSINTTTRYPSQGSTGATVASAIDFGTASLSGSVPTGHGGFGTSFAVVSADYFPYTTSLGVFSATPVTSLARGLVALNTEEDMRVYLGLSGLSGGGGENNTATNIGGETGLYAVKVGVDLRFRSLSAGTNVTLTSAASTIGISVPTVGETNTASNIGGGNNVWADKLGVDLRFRTLIAGTNVTITSAVSSLTINSSGGAGTVDMRDVWLLG